MKKLKKLKLKLNFKYFKNKIYFKRFGLNIDFECIGYLVKVEVEKMLL